jgi:hypothetical protein
MPKLRPQDVDIDIDELEAVEYSTEDFETYEGEVPPIGLTLSGAVKKMWYTRSAKKADGTGDDPMIKVLWVAADNEGDNEEYNGCAFWLNAPLIPGAKFRWDPFLLCYGLTLKQVKTQTYISKTADQNGWAIERIGQWHPGLEHDEAWSYIVTGREAYNGDWKPIAKEWIAWDELEEAEEPEDEPEDVEDEEEPEDEPEEEDEEPEEDEEEPEEPPARTRRARSAKTPARSSRTASKPAPARTASRTRSGGAKPAPARTARATAKTPARASAAKAPARSTRTKRSGSRDDPPF